MITLVMTQTNPTFTKKDLNFLNALATRFHSKQDYYKELGEYVIDYLKKQYNQDYFLSCWWANYYEKGQHAETHHHKPETISAIYVVKSSKYNPITFYDQNKKGIKIVEEDGLLIIFPSETAHSVDKCREKRITLALDFKLKI